MNSLAHPDPFPLHAPQHPALPLHHQIDHRAHLLHRHAHLGIPFYRWHRRPTALIQRESHPRRIDVLLRLAIVPHISRHPHPSEPKIRRRRKGNANSPTSQVIGNFATLSVNMPDFSRYSRVSVKWQWLYVPMLPIIFTFISFIGIACTSAGQSQSDFPNPNFSFVQVYREHRNRQFSPCSRAAPQKGKKG